MVNPTASPAPPEHAHVRRRFRLLRFFSIATLAALLLAAVGLGFVFRQTALKQVIRMGEENNVALAHVLSGMLRPYYGPLMDLPMRSAADDERALGLVAQIHRTVRESIRDTRVLSLSIYDRNGRSIYSSDPHAQHKLKGDAAFEAAVAGTVRTTLNHSDSFDAFGLMLTDRSVLTTFVPIRRSTSGGAAAVVELATDVTGSYEQIRRTQTALRFATASVLVLIFAAVFFAARRADARIAAEEDERERDADTIRHLAHHDDLTGLPNRKLFLDRLACAVARAKRSGGMVALMFIDLDRFKAVNDTLGHAAGDKVLIAASTLLRSALRTTDTVARMGGDEFTIIVENVGDRASVETVADKIRAAFAAPVARESGIDLSVTPSIGIALFPRDADSPEALLDAADAAMYDAKAAGRNAFCFYTGVVGSEATQPEPAPA